MTKKVLALVVLAILISLSAIGCIKSASNSVVSLSVNFVATSNQLGSYPLGSTASSGYTYVITDVTVTNLNKNDLYIGNPNYFKLTTSDGAVHPYSPASYWLSNQLTGVTNTKVGDKVTGKIAFEIPQSTHATQLTYGDGFNPSVTTNL